MELGDYMTAIAHMPDTAVGDGAADDTAALQAMFDAVPTGGGCIIPDGVFRVTSGLHVPRPMNVWCSPGAHIKGDFAGTDPVVWIYWNTPDDVSDLYAAMQDVFWDGGTISRLNRNGPCLRASTLWDGCLQNIRLLRGSPFVRMDSPDTQKGGYWAGGFPNYSGVSRLVGCRGYDGGPIGMIMGDPEFGSPATNGHAMEHCYFEGDGSAGSIGVKMRSCGSSYMMGQTLKNYQYGHSIQGTSSPITIIGEKMINVTQPYYGVSGTVNLTVVDPRGWEGTKGSMTDLAARDSQGQYVP